MSAESRYGFWEEALAINRSVAVQLIPRVLLFGFIAAGLCGLILWIESISGWRLILELMPHELAGAALGLLLVLRTNSGYDRWWEARKLWGGFVDRTRNVVIGALAYGPADRHWREEFVRWTAAYPHVARMSLRGERNSPELVRILGAEDAQKVTESDHMPIFVGSKLAAMLREACDHKGMDRFYFLQVDRERAMLIDNYGGCERILLTPLPLVYSIKIRHFIVLFLLTLPLALLHRLENPWLTPFLTMLVAYPMLSLDQMGIELENPFATENFSHLPIDGISATIERNVFALLKQQDSES